MAIIVVILAALLYLLWYENAWRFNVNLPSTKEDILPNGLTEAEYLEHFKTKIMGMDKTNA